MKPEQAMMSWRFDIAPGVAWVDLTVPAAAGSETVDTDDFRVTYYDTRGLRWNLAGICLTRTTGSADPGWQLVMPTSGGDPVKLSVPLAGRGGRPIPAELLDRVQAWTRNHQVRPIVGLSIHRTTHSLAGSSRTLKVTGADTVMTARLAKITNSGRKALCREWVVQFDNSVPESAATLYTDVGGSLATWSSPLDDALGRRPRRTIVVQTGELSRSSRSGDVLGVYFEAQRNALLQHDFPARHDEPDGVHKMRVATRRLRSALSTFRPLLEHRVTDPVRGELTWLGGRLGAARDAEVLRDRVLSGLPDDPHGSETGSVSDRIAIELHADHRVAQDRLARTLRSRRYFELLDRLDMMIAEFPLTALAEQPAGTVLTGMVRSAYRRLNRLVIIGPAAFGRAGLDPWFHEIRKAAKRLRYAAEALEPAFGEPARALAGAAEHLQGILGEHQDSVVAREVLHDIGIRVHDHGDSSATIELLHAREQARSNETAAAFTAAWDALTDQRLHTWLA